MLRIKKASAGSGKTFTLARQYLTLLLGHRDQKSGKMKLYTDSDYGFGKTKPHSHILAITFTKKATQEMTNRIISELSLLTQWTPEAAPSTLAAPKKKKSAHMEFLCETYGAEPHQIVEAARRALADLLFNFSYFNVSTIDSFFQNVLRIFTRELDLPEIFNLEIDENYPVAVAVGEMFQSINLPEETTDDETRSNRLKLKNWMKAYMDTLLEEGENANLLARSSKVSRTLVKTLTNLRGESYKAHRREIQQYLSDPKRIDRFTQGMNASLQAWRRRLTDASRSFQDLYEARFVPKNLTKYTFGPWAEGDFSFNPLEGKRSTLTSAINDRELRYNKTQTKKYGWPDDVDALLLQLLETGRDYFLAQTLYGYLRRQIFLLGLFSESERHIDEYCREKEAFLLGDTNLLLRKVICDAEAPFVYERIGYIINHFLIDEFQDTSGMQWENLKPLIKESMSRRQDDLIIGDEKQCIYRFRNSNPELLGHEVEDEMTSIFSDEAVEVTGSDIRDNTNWRSARNIVMFNNTLFGRLARLVDEGMKKPMAGPTYAALVQQVCPDNLKPDAYPGLVKMFFFNKQQAPSADDADRSDTDLPSLDLASVDRSDKEEAPNPEALAQPMGVADQQLRQLGEELSREFAAGYRPGDVAVLVRKHYQGEAVIKYLYDLMGSEEWSHGPFEIMSDDALEISASPSIQLIVSILRLITTPQYILDDRLPREQAILEEKKVINPAYLRNRLIHRFELCTFDETQASDPETGELLFNPDGSPKMRRLTPSEALAKAVSATTPQPGDAALDSDQRQIDQLMVQTAETESPSLFTIVERLVRQFLTPEARVKESAFISAFQDLVLDFEEKGDADLDSFLDWWDSKGRMMTLPPPEGKDALRVMTIHQAKGLEMPCVHIPYCDPELFRNDNLEWYPLDRHGFPHISPDDVPPLIPLNGKAEFAKIDMLAPRFDEICQTQKVDCLNVIYVAFTRAAEELIVYSSAKSAKNNTLAPLLIRALQTDPQPVETEDSTSPEEDPTAQPKEDPKAQWLLPLAPHFGEDPVTGTLTFQLGSERSEPQQSNTDSAETEEIKAEEQEKDSQEKSVEIPYQALLNSYPSHLPAEMIITDEMEQQGVFDIHDERHVGNFLHDVLAHVKTPADLPRAMARGAYRRAIAPPDWHPYFHRLQSALADPRVQPWFADFERVMTERPLTASEGLRRPDRVVFHPDGSVTVIDYKFGSLTDKYLPLYREQVRDYMVLLSNCGYRNLRGFLFYPLAGAILPVD